MAERWQLWMPFHIDRFRGSPDVQAMHAIARCGYLYLLASQWQTSECALPSDSDSLASLSGLGDELWAQYGPRILRKFSTDEHGRLVNLILRKEWEEAQRIYEARSASARRTNEVRSAPRSPSADHAVTTRRASRRADTTTGTGTETKTRTIGVGVGVFSERSAPEHQEYDFPLKSQAMVAEGRRSIEFTLDP